MIARRLLEAMLVCIAVGLAASVAGAQDPVRVEARLAESEIRVGETVVLEIVVETRGPAPDPFDLPRLDPDLRVVGSRDESQLQFTMPGGRTRTQRRVVTLMAAREGTFDIPPLVIQVQGRRYETRPLRLRVLGATRGAAPAPPPGAPGGETGPGGEVVFRAWLEPGDTVWVGQQVHLRVEALFSDDVRLRLVRAPQYSPPSPSGFWVQDLPGSGRPVRRVLGGRVYDAHVYSRALFPLEPGVSVVPPARLRYDVRRGFLMAPESEELFTDSLRVVVVPLPSEGRPPSFTGAVGRYRVHAELTPARVPAGEAASLVVEVRGEGNLRALPAPQLPAVPALRAYAPREEATVSTTDGSVQGVKRFEWVVVAESPGRIEIPAIAYGYFDPDLNGYAVTRSAPLVLHADPPPGEVHVAASGTAALRPLRSEARPDRLGWVRTTPFLTLMLLPLLALGLVSLRRRRFPAPALLSRLAISRARRRLLAELEGVAVADAAAFFQTAEPAVRDWLAGRLGADGRVPADGIVRTLTAAGVRSDDARALADVLARLRTARFRPEPPGPAARREFLAELVAALAAVDRQARRPARRTPTAPGAAGLLLLVVAAATACGDRADGRPRAARDAFANGVAAFQAGGYAAAVGDFESHIAANPRDPDGWYNLGNAHFRAGDPGRAVRAWLRALRLDPRHGDARANLAAVGTSPELVRRAATRVPLSANERLLAAGLLWLLAGGAVVAFAISGRRGFRLATLLASGGVIAVLASLAPDALAPTPALVLDPETPLHAAPALRAEVRRVLGPGLPVELVDVREDWVRVRLRDGVEGWVEAGHVGRF